MSNLGYALLGVVVMSVVAYSDVEFVLVLAILPYKKRIRLGAHLKKVLAT
jgi:hypothetical protein